MQVSPARGSQDTQLWRRFGGCVGVALATILPLRLMPVAAVAGTNVVWALVFVAVSGTPAGAVAGALIGPAAVYGTPRDARRRAVGGGLLAVPLGALTMSGLLVAMQGGPLEVVVIAWPLYAATGIVIFGIPALMVTLPAGFIAVAVIRRLHQRLEAASRT